jgi:glycerate 2-kinase
MDNYQQIARDIFLHALKQADIAQAFARHFHYERGVWRVFDDLFALDRYARVHVVAFGKAAQTMAEAMVAQLGPLANGIIAAPEASLAGKPQLPNFRYFSGGHPLPNAESVKAADAILKSLASLPPNSLVLYLISGGGSSIVEKPIDAEITLADLIATYKTLVYSGAPIAEMNAIRKHLSALKGGRLAQAAAKPGGTQQVSVLVSDVPDNALDALASGPTMPDSTSVEDCYAVAAKHGMVAEFPGSVRELFDKRSLEETPDKDDPCFHNARWWTLLSNATITRAAAAKASEHGFAVEIDNSCDDQDYAQAADYLLERLRQLRRGASKVCLISGGEVTVRVGADAGTGGRNQQFALYCATKITSERIAVLSAGTDGIDGNSPAAGAIADGTTLERYSRSGAGQSAYSALEQFNATPLFDSIGDLVTTGPTGNNLRDLRILLAW